MKTATRKAPSLTPTRRTSTVRGKINTLPQPKPRVRIEPEPVSKEVKMKRDRRERRFPDDFVRTHRYGGVVINDPVHGMSGWRGNVLCIYDGKWNFCWLTERTYQETKERETEERNHRLHDESKWVILSNFSSSSSNVGQFDSPYSVRFNRRGY